MLKNVVWAGIAGAVSYGVTRWYLGKKYEIIYRACGL